MSAKIPTVLSFERKLAPSDGFMYGTSWNERGAKAIELKLCEKAVRGTISNYIKKTADLDPMKIRKKMENANPQQVDACFLPLDCDTLVLRYTLKVLSGIDEPSASNDPAFVQEYKKLVDNYIAEDGFLTLAKRYATNIANGRALWRNRLGAEQIEVRVEADEKSWVFDARTIPFRDFEENAEINDLAEVIAAALSGKTSYLLLRIEMFAKVGTAQEVFPSEEMVFDKSKHDKSKILYSADGIAAMHSQKLGNAIRTVDTWYPDFGTAEGVGPIAAEVYGSVTSKGQAFRAKPGLDFYSIFESAISNGAFKTAAEAHYAMSVLIRGGVFGKSKDDKGKDNGGDAEQ